MTDTPIIDRPHGRIADIEILRAFAILFVLIEHAHGGLLNHMSRRLDHFYMYFGGNQGVDLFFAISGCVIARSLFPALEHARGASAYFNATLAFWIRRAWRLIPSAWLWLAVIMVCVLFFNRSGVFGTFEANLEGALAAALDIANFRLMNVYGHFATGASFPYWSLSLEEQFYFVLPIVVFLAGRKLPYILGAVVLAQVFLTRSGENGQHIELILNQIRSDALALGVLLAIWSRHEIYRLYEPVGLGGRPLAGLLMLALPLVAIGILGTDNLHIVGFPLGVVAVLAATLVWVASYNKDYLWPEGFSRRVLLWVGSRSYTLYLVHIPAYFMTQEIWFRIEPPGTVFGGTFILRFLLTAVVLLVALVELNYRLVEVPLRRKGARIAERIAHRSLEQARAA